jgi:hypothetical protein
MTDNGFKYLIQRLEAIYIQHSGRDVMSHMDFDFSKNILTESAILCFAEILRKFNAFRSVRMTNLGIRKGKDSCLLELAKALKENTSLVELDIRNNLISGPMAAKLLQALGDNFVLSVLKMDIQLKKLPDGFSSYPL